MWLELGLICLTLFIFLYYYITKSFNKWKDIGIPFVKGSFPFGSHVELMTQSKHLNELIRDDYAKYKEEDFHGMFLLGKPVLVVNSLEMIKHVMVKDFNHFIDRNDSNMTKAMDGGEYDQLWLKQMTSLSTDEWKDVRSTFSPIFTSGKMKGMLRFIKEIGGSLNLEFGKHADTNKEFELKVDK